jgi:hypothetical protein
MEWMLQVVDDIDDAIGALRLCFMGLRVELGAELQLICSAAIVLSLGAALKIHAWQLAARDEPV